MDVPQATAATKPTKGRTRVPPQATVVVGEHTVHRQVVNVCGKLGSPSRAAAVAHAASRDLLWSRLFRLPDQHGPDGPSYFLPRTWPEQAKPGLFVPA